MPRLIDAEKLKLHYAWWEGGSREMTMDEAKRDFDVIIDVQPTVDAEPVRHGRWEQMWEDDDQIQARCSCCGMVFWIGKGRDGNYCPNCGAKMDGERKEDVNIS